MAFVFGIVKGIAALRKNSADRFAVWEGIWGLGPEVRWANSEFRVQNSEWRRARGEEFGVQNAEGNLILIQIQIRIRIG